MVEYFGPHLIIDMSGCKSGVLNDPEKIKEFLERLPKEINMEVIDGPNVFRYDDPKDENGYGVTGVVIISTSHISIHTFPAREEFVTADIYSCKDFNTITVIQHFLEFFNPTKTRTQVIRRGTEL